MPPVVEIHVLAEHGELGRFVRLPGQGRRDEDAIVLHRADIGLGIADQAGQPIKQRPLRIGGARNVEVELLAAEGAALDLDLAERRLRRPLRDQVDDAGAGAGAIDRRGRTAQHADRLQPIGFEPHQPVRAADLAQAVAEHRVVGDVDAADGEGVVARVEAIGADARARRIGQRLQQVLRLALFELRLRHRRDRHRRLEQRRIGLGCAAAGGRDIAVGGEEALLAAALPFDHDRVELDTLCPLRQGGDRSEQQSGRPQQGGANIHGTRLSTKTTIAP